MAFTIEDIADGVVVRVCDARLDAAQAIHFKDRLRDVVGRNGPLILLGLGKVDFMDSSGLSAVRGSTCVPVSTGGWTLMRWAGWNWSWPKS